MSKRMAFAVDTSACVSCKTCEVACKDTFDLPIGPRMRRVREFAGGGWTIEGNAVRQNDVFTYGVSISCNHCEKPACVAACPTGAMAKDEETGIVDVDHEVCIACGTCQKACPYVAPQLYEEGKYLYKCNMCKDLMAEGKDPACVGSCPMRVIKVGEYDELVKEFGEARDIAPLPDSTKTEPNLVLNLHPSAKMSMDEGYVTNLYDKDADNVASTM